MPELTIQDVPLLGGLDPVLSAAAQDDFVVPKAGDGSLLIHVVNGDAAQHSLVIDDVNTTGPPGSVAFDPDVSVDVPAGGERFINLGQLNRFKNDNGEVHFDWSQITGMTVGVFRLR